MKKLNISQAWVSRVTTDPIEDLYVAGNLPATPPTEAELLSVIRKAASGTAVREMIRRKWFSATSPKATSNRTDAFAEYLFASPRVIPTAAAMFRRQHNLFDISQELTTLAWLRRVFDRAASLPTLKFDSRKLTSASIEQLVRLSKQEKGPMAAVKFVEQLGIRVIIESTLPGMRTDGAAFLSHDEPVICLTLRFDRIDSFWFTLLHEIAHVCLHLSKEREAVFVDSIEDDDDDVSESEIEAEADAFAKDSFIPRDAWLRSEAVRFGKESAILDLAKRFHIHPAIVAGRLRFEKKNFQWFTHLLGSGQVRSLLLSD